MANESQASVSSASVSSVGNSFSVGNSSGSSVRHSKKKRKIQNLETPPVKIGNGYFTTDLGKLRSTQCDLLSTNDVINSRKRNN